MTDVVIFPEQTVQFEATEQPGGVYRVIAPSPFVLVLGETYRVVLDGIAHVSTCVEFEGVPCIANVDDLYTEEMPPDGTFVIQYIPADEISSDDVAYMIIVDSLNSTHHTLAIYQTEAVSNDVITENWDGSTEVHPGVESVSLETEDGGEKKFILEDLIPEQVEATVELDFSGGDMTITPQAGQTFSSISIPKPDNLIPDNIAADKDVAGIIGALKAGSGVGGNAVFKNGTYKPTSNGPATITHGLGVMPDIFVIAARYPKKCGATYPILYTWGFSTAFGTRAGALATIATDVMVGQSSNPADVTLDASSTQVGHAYNATETTIDVGATFYLQSGQEYLWFAIGGLT